MIRYSALTSVLIILAVSTTIAQSGFGIGPQIGIFKARDADDSRVMGGAALRIKFSEFLGAEGSINYREEDYNNGTVVAKSWPVMVTGLIYPLPLLYGGIGAGWYNTSVEYNIPPSIGGGLVASETSQKVGWHFGGGVELPLGGTGKLVGDIRYVFLDYNFKTLPGSNGVNSDFYVITAGLLFGL